MSLNPRSLPWSIAFTAAVAALPAAAVDLGVSISIAQPGLYGRIDIGEFPRPRLVSSQPVVIVPGAHRGGPVYLHVPPGHRKHWDKHCDEYRACGVPVYFVTQEWYDSTYVPEYRRRHDDRGDRGDRDRRYRERDRDDDHGKGRGRGGKDKDRD